MAAVWYVSLYDYACMLLFVLMYICMYIRNVWWCMCTYICKDASIHTYVHLCILLCVCVCVCACVQAFLCAQAKLNNSMRHMLAGIKALYMIHCLLLLIAHLPLCHEYQMMSNVHVNDHHHDCLLRDVPISNF